MQSLYSGKNESEHMSEALPQFNPKFAVFLRQCFGGRLFQKRKQRFIKYWCYFLKFYDDQKRGESERQPLKAYEEAAELEVRQRLFHGITEEFYKKHFRATQIWKLEDQRRQRINAGNSSGEKRKQKKAFLESSGCEI